MQWIEYAEEFEVLGMLLDAFHLNSGGQVYNLEEALALMINVQKCDEDLKKGVRNNYDITDQLQGPQGSVLSVFSASLVMLVDCLISLQPDYPSLKTHVYKINQH